MNEVELIRAQLSLERQHAMEVARGLAAAGSLQGGGAAALNELRQASVDYLVWILSRFEEREQVFHDLLRARLAAEDQNRRAVEAALASPGTSREALARLEAALATPTDPARWVEFLDFFSTRWIGRRDELDKLFAQQAKVTDWRAVSGIDADSILEERTRYTGIGSIHQGLGGPPPSSADSL